MLPHLICISISSNLKRYTFFLPITFILLLLQCGSNFIFFRMCFVTISSIHLKTQLLFKIRHHRRRVRARNLNIAHLNCKILVHEPKAIPFFFTSQSHCPRTIIFNSSTMILSLFILYISLIEATIEEISFLVYLSVKTGVQKCILHLILFLAVLIKAEMQ